MAKSKAELTPAQQALTDAKQVLRDTEAELAERTVIVSNLTNRVAELRGLISKWRGEMKVDGVDHTERIADAEEEIEGTEADELLFWQDAKQLLETRVVEAQEAVETAEQDQRMETLQTLLDQEPELRKSFARAMATFAESAENLRKLIADKEAIVNASFEHGTPIRDQAGDLAMPTIPNAAVNWWSGGAARMSKELLAKLN